MISDTEVDHRAADAAAEIQAAVHHITPHRTLPTRPRVRRPVAISVVATVLVAAGITTMVLADRHDPTTVASTGPVELPYLLPHELPDGVELHRVDTTTSGTVAYVVYAPSRNWQQGAILAQAITTDGPITSTPEGDCRVRDLACSYSAYPVDNGATFGILIWQEAGASMSLQSATAGRDALLAAATELVFADGRITNRTLAGYPLAASGTGPADARTVTDSTGSALTFTITSAADDTPIDFLPGRAVDIGGHPGWLSHQPADRAGHLAATVTWRPAPGVSASLYTRTSTDEQLLRIARTVAPVSQAAWDRLPAR